MTPRRLDHLDRLRGPGTLLGEAVPRAAQDYRRYVSSVAEWLRTRPSE